MSLPIVLPAAGSGPPVPGKLQPAPHLPHYLIQQIGQRGWLESYAVAWAILAVAGAVAAWGFGCWLRHRHGGPRLLPRVPRWAVRTWFAGACVLLGVAGVGVALNAYVGYLPSIGAVTGVRPAPAEIAAGVPGKVALQAGSRVLSMQIGAPAYGVAPRAAYVYLPPGYSEPSNARRRYPVVYLIQGFPGTSADWFRAGKLQSTMDLLIQDHAVGPMIVVSPDVSDNPWWVDSECLNIPGGLQLESYVAYTVVDTIDRDFRTIANRSGRAIGGMSAGGFCALNIGLHHLHRFSVILASEPYGDPGRNALLGVLRRDSALYRVNSPSFYLPMWHFPVPVAVFFDAGANDPQTSANSVSLAHDLLAAGQTVAVRIAPGLGHSWYEARVELPYSLVFAWDYLGRLPLGGSDVLDADQVASVLQYAQGLPPLVPALPTPSPAPSRSARPTPKAVHPSASPTPSGEGSPRPSGSPSPGAQPSSHPASPGPTSNPKSSPTPSPPVSASPSPGHL